MPKITMEFSIPEDPTRNTVTVTIEGPDEKQVARSAMFTIEHYTGLMSPAILRIPVRTGGAGGTCPACESGYHSECTETLNDGSLCDCRENGHPAP